MTQVIQQQNPMQPKPSVGAVNIQIYNPSVSPGFVQPAPCVNGSLLPALPLNYYYPINPYVQLQPVVQQPVTNPITTPTTQQATPPVSAASPIAENTEAKQKEIEKPQKKREVVQITDDYLKTLENYMSVKDSTEPRLMAIKEVLKRFKEDKSRYYDVGLTKLLNKGLRDQNSSVRALALSILGANYASGDDETMQILKEMQTSNSSYNQDALTASKILLERAGQKKEVVDNSHYPKEEKKKAKENNESQQD